LFVLVYEDDLLMAAKSLPDINQLKGQICKRFDARDLGEAKMFLGMVITRDRATRTIHLSQTRAILDLASEYGLADAKPKGTPLAVGIVLSHSGDQPTTEPYSSLIGSLLYLSITTRPDIAFAVGALSRFLASPTTLHWQCAKGVARYLLSNSDHGLTFTGNSLDPVGYCDADFAGDTDTRRSTTGYVFMLNGGAVSWASKRQPTVAASTTEAEYMAAAFAAKEGLWLRKLFAELSITSACIQIKGDNQSALKLLKHPVNSARSKHIDVIHHFVRERVAMGQLDFTYVSTQQQTADVLTIALPADRHAACCMAMGIGA
jgi:hypothetical protein